MVTRLYVAKDLDKREEELQKILHLNNVGKTHPDVLYFSNDSKLGVEQTKEIREFLSIKPYSAQVRLVIIESAHNLSADAQNSLLKTLEEPPLNSVITLATEDENKLLPTILSRCQIININGNNQKEPQLNENAIKQIEDLRELELEKRFQIIEKTEDKEKLFVNLLLYFQNQLKSGKYLDFTKLLLEADTWRKSNVQIRPILEFLMFKLPKK